VSVLITVYRRTNVQRIPRILGNSASGQAHLDRFGIFTVRREDTNRANHQRDLGKDRFCRRALARWRKSGLTIRDFCAGDLRRPVACVPHLLATLPAPRTECTPLDTYLLAERPAGSEQFVPPSPGCHNIRKKSIACKLPWAKLPEVSPRSLC
jgi:hypothetical protein